MSGRARWWLVGSWGPVEARGGGRMRGWVCCGRRATLGGWREVMTAEVLSGSFVKKTRSTALRRADREKETAERESERERERAKGEERRRGGENGRKTEGRERGCAARSGDGGME